MPQIRTLLTALILGLALSVTIPLVLPATLRAQILSIHGLRLSLEDLRARLYSVSSTGALFSTASSTDMSTRTPVYFMSHGGPTIFENTEHPAHLKLKEIGREITQQVKPKAVVVFSAHWQADRDAVEVNTATSMGLIYDYYGFPAHFYSVQYPNTGSPELADKILGKLEGAGIKAEGVRRGLDHGVFAPFLVAFNPETNPLNVPLVQVSLFDSDSGSQHQALGRALATLRDENILLICSGMAVHNLRDMRIAFGRPGSMPYTTAFDDALRDATELAPEKREKAMEDLLKLPLARKAHPTFEHLLPIYIAAGAAGEDVGKRTWTMHEGCLSWAQYRFGEVPALA